MFFVDDFPVIRIVQRLFAKLPVDFFFQCLKQLVANGSIAENIVRGNAGLSAVEIFPEYNPSCSEGNLCCGIYDTRTFSAKLQGDRSQVFGSMTKDFFSDRFSAGEKDLVKTLVLECLIFFSASGDHCYIF